MYTGTLQSVFSWLYYILLFIHTMHARAFVDIPESLPLATLANRSSGIDYPHPVPDHMHAWFALYMDKYNCIFLSFHHAVLRVNVLEM